MEHKDKIKFIIILTILLVALNVAFLILFLNTPDNVSYDSGINPSDFVDNVNNKYFTFTFCL